jgi:redox-sensitive bicupin YhaK (pirin superfamily)
MTAGRGITHAEEATGHYSGTLEGVQLWVAQTSETRNGDPRFEHHAELPRWQSERSEGIVFAGEHDTWRAPTTHDHPLVGQELWVHGSSVMSLRPDFEYGIVVLDGSLTVEHVDLEKGRLAYLRPGRDELPLASVGARAILLGGQPFQEKIVMWWNFVGRATEEFDAALTQWQSGDDRFGQLTSALPRFSSPQPWWGQQYRQFAR